MNAQELYDEIKAALKYFDLMFHEMDKIQVTVLPNAIVLRHDEASVAFSLPQEPTSV